jgi:FkbM family methyltransferase
MRVPPEDYIGGVLCSGVPYEVELLEKMSVFITPDAVILDVGANIGNHAVFWALINGAKVIAVEPNPEALLYLRNNVSLNHLADSIDIRATAAGAHKGTAEVSERTTGNLGRTILSYGSGPLPVTTVDSIVGSTRVSLIKIDVEGAEATVLAGAVGVLTRDWPPVICEAADDHYIAAIDAVLVPLGYVRAEENLAWTPTYLWSIPATPLLRLEADTPVL